jgi:hypothetical protein
VVIALMFDDGSTSFRVITNSQRKVRLARTLSVLKFYGYGVIE